MKSLHEPLIYRFYKPSGPTTQSILSLIKRNNPGVFGRRGAKLGHMGTLDPFACGLVLVGVGQGTRITEYVHEELPKTYLGIGMMGGKTNTGDATEGIQFIDSLAKSKLQKIFGDWDNDINKASKKEEIRLTMESHFRKHFLGEYWQSPHPFSASKFKGKPLYEYARHGDPQIRPPVKRTIHSLSVVKFCYPYLLFRATVSSGTFIRVLFSEMMESLGTWGYLQGLVRESFGSQENKSSATSLHYRHAYGLKTLNETPLNLLKGLSPDEVLGHWPKIDLNESESQFFLNGRDLNFYQKDQPSIFNHSTEQEQEQEEENRLAWVYSRAPKLMGINNKSFLLGIGDCKRVPGEEGEAENQIRCHAKVNFYGQSEIDLTSY